MKRHAPPPVVLCILDGFGIAPASPANAITGAKMPTWQRLWKTYPHTTLQASGRAVGLPAKQAGNSEAGHITIGAGRVVPQDSVLITQSIKNGTFFRNAAFIGALKHVREHKSALHLMGLLTGEESGHAYPSHLWALLDFCRQKKIGPVYLHLFTDGRDAPLHAAGRYLKTLQKHLSANQKIATVTGRFYAMDRNKRWDRTAAAYHAMTLGKGFAVNSPEEALLHTYEQGETDEYVPPCVVHEHGKPLATIKSGDAVIFWNLRSDRARQLTKPFVQPQFERRGGFRRQKTLKNLYFVALTDFGPDLDSVVTAYPSVPLTDTLPVALGGLRQFYVAESEKYAHVTYFLNGGYADPVAGEERQSIPSPKTKHYDATPAMSAKKIVQKVATAVRQNRYDFVVLNLANADMVAHSGNFLATTKALAVVDECLAALYDTVTSRGGTLIITGDHGNADCVRDIRTDEAVTEHTHAPVPFLLINRQTPHRRLHSGGLANVAPTILKIMHRPIPAIMTKPLL